MYILCHVEYCTVYLRINGQDDNNQENSGVLSQFLSLVYYLEMDNGYVTHPLTLAHLHHPMKQYNRHQYT